MSIFNFGVWIFGYSLHIAAHTSTSHAPPRLVSLTVSVDIHILDFSSHNSRHRTRSISHILYMYMFICKQNSYAKDALDKSSPDD